MANRTGPEARSAKLRTVYAALVAGPASVSHRRIEADLTAISRETSAGPAPWTILTPTPRDMPQEDGPARATAFARGDMLTARSFQLAGQPDTSCRYDRSN